MKDEKRQEIMRRYKESMCAMSEAQMAIRAAEQEDDMRNALPDLTSVQLAQASSNFWRQEVPFVPANPPPPPTLWARFKRWIRG